MGINTLQAQYVPKSQRKGYQNSGTIEIKPKQTYKVNKSFVVCDTLIMHDKATLRVIGQKRFVLYARYVKIGKKCVIDADGANGTKKAPNAKNGTHLLLNMNIYALGNLLIKTRGGNGYQQRRGDFSFDNSQQKRLRLGGSGGNVQFNYFSPLVISRRKPSGNQATVWFSTTRGKSFMPPRPKAYKPKDKFVQGVVNGKMITVHHVPADPNRSNPPRSGEYRDAKAQVMRLSKGKVGFQRVGQPLKF
jgi:hypothetical protein